MPADSSLEPKKLDTSSIKTTTMFSFVMYAMILITVLWVLASFFLDTYYQKVRTQEVIRTASAIESQYRKSPSTFESYAIETAGINGIYIRLVTLDTTLSYDGTSGLRNVEEFDDDISRINQRMAASEMNSVTEVRHSASSDTESRLVYAANIESGNRPSALYIIAPLYPDQATIRIVKNMLLYITFILLALAVLLAYALSRRITSPIENLTKSATELSRGNYNDSTAPHLQRPRSWRVHLIKRLMRWRRRTSISARS